MLAAEFLRVNLNVKLFPVTISSFNRISLSVNGFCSIVGCFSGLEGSEPLLLSAFGGSDVDCSGFFDCSVILIAPGLQADPLGEPGAELLVEMAVDSDFFHYCPFSPLAFFIVFIS